MDQEALRRIAEEETTVTARTLEGEDNPSIDVEGELHISQVPGHATPHYVVAGGNVDPETIVLAEPDADPDDYPNIDA